jgi:hypothetical protein
MGFFKKILPNDLYRKFLLEKNNPFIKFFNESYSQEGEDMILRRIFENKKSGFYVDVGAYHPKRFSNTYYFYKRGWLGINIEARPGSKQLFDKIRPRDINIEVPISNFSEELTYYAFDEPALNGLIKDLADLRVKNKAGKILFTKKMNTSTLSEILDKYLPKNTVIDFMSIDVEGLDLNVLESNNWDKYQPRYILIEDLDQCNTSLSDSTISKFLIQKNYSFFAKTVNTYFYVSSS